MIKTKKEMLNKIDELNELLKKQNDLLEHIANSALDLNQRKQQNNYFHKNKNQNEQKIENKKEFQFYTPPRHNNQIQEQIEYLPISHFMEKWGLTRVRISMFCTQGRIKGAIKDKSNRWLIPANAKKPRDRRHKLVIACKNCGWVLDSEKITGTRWCRCGNVGISADDNGSTIVGNENLVKPIFNFWKDKHFVKRNKNN
ncbi:MAG: hypothetical protein J6A98_00615 [Clostridia bacterium]|nr:hypothetical protein [Clostridia bacterium]